MKLVLAGSREHYNAFLEKLWEKDIDTRSYRYIHRIDTILGLDDGQELIILGNAREHPQFDYLRRECQARGIFRRSAESRRGERIGHGRHPGYALHTYDESVPQNARIQPLASPPPDREPRWRMPEPMRGTEASLSIIDEPMSRDERIADAEATLSADRINDAMERMRESSASPSEMVMSRDQYDRLQQYTAPESGQYQVHTQTGVHYGQTPEEAYEAARSAQDAEASFAIEQQVAQEQERLQSQERTIDGYRYGMFEEGEAVRLGYE